MTTTKQIKVPAFTVARGAYQQAAPPPRRVPFGLVAFVLLLALGVGSAVVGWRVLSQPRAATPAATAQPAAPVESGARPQEDAPAPLAVVTPVVETMTILGAPRADPTPTPRQGPRPTATRALRGGPLPTPNWLGK